MKIQKQRWMSVRSQVMAVVPEPLRHRVAMPTEADGFSVEIDGRHLMRVYSYGLGVALENRASFIFGTEKRGHQMQDLERALRDEVFSALDLRRGHCGHWGYADGTRIDGGGTLQRSPIDEALDALEAMERAEAERATST